MILTAEHLELKRTIINFVEKEINPFVEEWEESAHATSLTAAGGMVANNNGCIKCHVSEAFVGFRSYDI